MNRRTLLKNLLSAAGQTVVQTVLLFFLYRYLIRQLGIEQFGIWSVVLATASAARISELGLSSSVTRFVATYRAQGDDRAAGETLQTAAVALAVVLGLFLFALYPVFVIVLRFVVPPEAIAAATGILPFALVSMWLIAMSGLWLGGLDGCLRTDVRAALVTSSSVAYVAMAVVGVRNYGLYGLAVAQVGQGLLLMVFGWLAIRRVIGGLPAVPVQWRRARFVEIFGYGANVQVMTAVTILLDPATKVMFARFGGLSATGYFELTQQLVLKMRALIVESNRVIVPVMAGMAEQGNDARRLYATNVRYLVFLITPMFAGLASLAPGIAEIWLGYYERDFVVMTVALTAAWYLNSLSAPAYFSYLGEGRLRWLTASHAIMGVSNVALGAALGYLFGWPGVLAAFSTSLVIGGFVAVSAYHREHHIRVRDVVSRQDLLMAGTCMVLAVISVCGYDLMIEFGLSASSRVAFLAVTGLAIAAATWRHPLASALLMRVRRRASRGVKGVGGVR